MDGIARVFVNSVEVGSLPEPDYRDIVMQVKAEYRHYLMAGLRLLRSAVIAAEVMLRALGPISLVLLAMLLWITPDSVTQFLEALQKASPVEIVALLKNVAVAAFILSLLTLGAMLTFGYNFGYVSPWEDACNKRLRRLLEVPAEGNIVVIVERRDHANQP